MVVTSPKPHLKENIIRILYWQIQTKRRKNNEWPQKLPVFEILTETTEKKLKNIKILIMKQGNEHYIPFFIQRHSQIYCFSLIYCFSIFN